VKRMMSTVEIAYLYDLSPDDVIALCRVGKIKARKEGKYWRVHPMAAKKFFSEHEHQRRWGWVKKEKEKEKERRRQWAGGKTWWML